MSEEVPLWNDSVDKNGYASEEQYREHILEQYKVYVEMADRISIRRDIANSFFLTLNGLVLAASASIIEKGISFKEEWMLVVPLLVFWAGCYFWWRLVASYRQLNAAKFRIVGEFESRLPASPYGCAEWKHLLAEGKDKKKYWPLTHIEQWIPAVFALVYLVGAVSIWFS